MNYGYSYMKDGNVYITASNNKSRLDVYKNNLSEILEKENVIELVDEELNVLTKDVQESVESNAGLKKVLYVDNFINGFVAYFGSIANHDYIESIPAGVLGVLSLMSYVNSQSFVKEENKKVSAINSKTMYLNLQKEKLLQQLQKLQLDSKVTTLGEKYVKYYLVSKDECIKFKNKYDKFSSLIDNPKSLKEYLYPNKNIYEDIPCELTFDEYTFNNEEIKILDSSIRKR